MFFSFPFLHSFVLFVYFVLLHWCCSWCLRARCVRVVFLFFVFTLIVFVCLCLCFELCCLCLIVLLCARVVLLVSNMGILV